MANYTNQDIIKIIAQNMFRHQNFWNFQNFRHRLHVLWLMLMPVSCNDEKLRSRYNTAKYNFWSCCGDKMDYDYFIGIRHRLAECKTK
ncbi:MAG: hypothetical protein IJY77_00910 [Alphaproteobacteria bacterium]|nr:hypothetical protein [Alphaproteobacteria bacterium]